MENLQLVTTAAEAGDRQKIRQPLSGNPFGRTLYIEEAIAAHPAVRRIREQFGKDSDAVVYCESYREVFNPRNKHFRMRKEAPALLLAHKPKSWVQPSPYGIGGQHNYYFSHILNCIYDCRYCFLQGLYSSAILVLFVNYEDFFADIDKTLRRHPKEEVSFFSGYDSDSLAYEPVTHFVSAFLPFFEERPRALLELRTKSAQVQPLLARSAISNCVVAFSLAPQSVVTAYEAKTPSLEKRLESMEKLANAGWQIGIRLDPIIPMTEWKNEYADLIRQLGKRLPEHRVHSVTLGTLRFPMFVYKNMRKIYPTEKLLVENIVTDKKQQAVFEPKLAQEITEFCLQHLADYYPAEKVIRTDGE